jgi:chromosome segregation ATPase
MLAFKFRPVHPRRMEDEAIEAVREFIREANDAYDEYEQGYADADATLRVLRAHLDRLETAVDPATDGE